MFKIARPVFPRGKEKQVNTFVTFHGRVSTLENAEIHITAADFYQLYVDGEFVAFGPARAAKGYAREDVIDLCSFGVGEHRVDIAVSCYYCGSLSAVKQPGFLWCEIVRGDEVLMASGRDVIGCERECRVRRAQRYSLQRHFCDDWDFTKEGMFDEKEPAELKIYSEDETPVLLPRRAPYADYSEVGADGVLSRGRLVLDETLKVNKDFYSHGAMPTEYGAFSRDEIEHFPYEWIQTFRQERASGEAAFPVELSEGEYAIIGFDRIENGFVKFSAFAHEDSALVFGFSEKGSGDVFTFPDMHAHNAFEYAIPGGRLTSAMTFESYVVQYMIVCVKKGRVRFDSLGIKGFSHTLEGARTPEIGDGALKAIYRGAARTFAHNALDIYMDCPSRERAGWLCDSYFTAKTEYALFGETRVEDAFLENYRLYKNEGAYPKGVIPMCYPSTPHKRGEFIPQWTMWFILEVEDYVNNRGHKKDAELFRGVINGLLDFYSAYENTDGLLEKLPNWNFVEWSVANKWTQDVSYPTNFLYAQVLECVYKLYGEEKHREKCERVRRIAVEQSFNGTVFLDHAVRDYNCDLVRQNDCSEACQYYAILFGGIDVTEPKYKELHRLVLDVFRAERIEKHPEIAEINAFIGAYLRLEALLKLEEYDLVLRDLKEFFGNMEALTGTLWEYRSGNGSRDHGFASYALVAMVKALEGLK